MRPLCRGRRAGRPSRRNDFASWPAVRPGRLTLPARTCDGKLDDMCGEDVPLLSIVKGRPAIEGRDPS